MEVVSNQRRKKILRRRDEMNYLGSGGLLSSRLSRGLGSGFLLGQLHRAGGTCGRTRQQTIIKTRTATPCAIARTNTLTGCGSELMTSNTRRESAEINWHLPLG